MNQLQQISSRTLTMSSLEISRLVESNHADVRRSIERLAERGVISLSPLAEVKIQRERREEKIIVYNLCKRDSLIVVAQLCPEFTAAIIDRWQQLEEQAEQNHVVSIPKTFAEALRLAADLSDQKLLAEQRAEAAEATKAEIGTRREATAMQTASVAVKKANKLEAELDRSKHYATVKRMEMIYHGQRFNWRHLKATASEVGIPAIDIFDANYGTVKSYHADVWKEAYALEISRAE